MMPRRQCTLLVYRKGQDWPRAETEGNKGAAKQRKERREKETKAEVVAFSRCSCGQRVAGRLAGIELDGSSPGNRIFSLFPSSLPPSGASPLSLSTSLALCPSLPGSNARFRTLLFSRSLKPLCSTIPNAPVALARSYRRRSTPTSSLILSLWRLATPCNLRNAEDSRTLEIDRAPLHFEITMLFRGTNLYVFYAFPK